VDSSPPSSATAHDDDLASLDDDAPSSRREEHDPSYRAKAWTVALVVAGVTAATVTHAFRLSSAGPARMLPPLGLAYLVLAVGALRDARARGDLRAYFAPRRLDLTMGAVVAGVLFLSANLVPMALLSGRPAEDWLWRLYLQLGDPRDNAPPYVGAALLAVAALEEFVWRGWVMRALRRAHGAKVALVATTSLYGLAHVGTAFTLAAPDVGPNPLLVFAALGCGLVWGAMALRFERLGPSLCAHALFSWSVALFPLWARG
jgi:membrane protease YdiL (CAAX protease family)